jgi:hypothetical protein
MSEIQEAKAGKDGNDAVHQGQQGSRIDVSDLLRGASGTIGSGKGIEPTELVLTNPFGDQHGCTGIEGGTTGGIESAPMGGGLRGQTGSIESAPKDGGLRGQTGDPTGTQVGGTDARRTPGDIVPQTGTTERNSPTDGKIAPKGEHPKDGKREEKVEHPTVKHPTGSGSVTLTR